MNNEMTLSFVAIEENEALARMAMTCFITPLDPTIEEISEFKTIVSEAVTNAIIHGYECDGKSLVTVHAVIDENKVTMTVAMKEEVFLTYEQAMEPMFTTRPLHGAFRNGIYDYGKLCRQFVCRLRPLEMEQIVKFEKTFSPVAEASRMR